MAKKKLRPKKSTAKKSEQKKPAAKTDTAKPVTHADNWAALEARRKKEVEAEELSEIDQVDEFDLTLRQRTFVRQYILTMNAAEAARRSGYTTKNARQMAYKLLQNPVIQGLIKQYEEEQHRLYGVTAERIIGELARIAFGDLRHVMHEDERGLSLKTWNEIDPHHSSTILAISESHTEHGTSRSIRRYDKIKALDLLGRNKGLWNGSDDGDSGDKAARAALAERVSAAIRKRTGSRGKG